MGRTAARRAPQARHSAVRPASGALRPARHRADVRDRPRRGGRARARRRARRDRCRLGVRRAAELPAEVGQPRDGERAVRRAWRRRGGHHRRRVRRRHRQRPRAEVDPDGRYLLQWGSAGPMPDAADGHLNAPMHVAVFRGDAGHPRVRLCRRHAQQPCAEVPPQRDVRGEVGQVGKRPGRVQAAARYRRGAVRHRLRGRRPQLARPEVRADGGLIGKSGSHVDKGGQFRSPQGIAVDSHENVYVADPGIPGVLKFTAGGQPIGKWTTFGPGDPPRWLRSTSPSTLTTTCSCARARG